MKTKKHNLLRYVSVLLLCLSVFSFAACNKKSAESSSLPQSTAAAASLWDNAVYTADKTFGDGKKTLKVTVKADDKSVTFTLKTDAETVGEALLAENLIAGDQSSYGLYVKVVNGIRADYDTDKAYWAFFQNGAYMNTGVDATKFADGDAYELVYTK